MDVRTINQELLDFLDASPNAFFAIANMKKMLEEAGFQRLYEGRPWSIEPGKDYFVTRNDSALIAFRIPKKDFAGFQIMASHSDSPVFKIKTNAEIEADKKYVKLNVEKYGGLLCAPWFDRPLSVAGRVMARVGDSIETRLINIDRDLMIIPSLAIHMNRAVNDGTSYNAQKDMLPLLGGADVRGELEKLVADAAGVAPKDVLDADLFLYPRQKGTFVGLHSEFICSGRIDDLQCAFSSLKGLLASAPRESVAVHCVLDNEEVGSGSKQGAQSTFLNDTLRRLTRALGRTEDEFLQALTSSFMISADNAHSFHPNYPDKADPTNRPVMNKGIVIKYSANQKYTTDAVSGALFRTLCAKAGVPWQTFANRSDMLGGSTLGNLSNAQVALNTVDIGLPQLAMHSCCETAGCEDTLSLVKAAALHFSSSVQSAGDGSYRMIF